MLRGLLAQDWFTPGPVRMRQIFPENKSQAILKKPS
jgi:hypothetical protein